MRDPLVDRPWEIRGMVTKPYSELVERAERAVSAVKDAELRRVAFEKVLDDLLSDDSASAHKRANADSALGENTMRREKAPKVRARDASSRASRSGPRAHISEMIDEGFFKKQKTISEVKAELENRGHHIPLTSLSGPLQTLCQRRQLRRQKVDGKGNKKTFAYSNW